MKKLNKGLLIVVDGLDRTGKTTLIRKIEKWLIEEGYDILLTKEPGGTELGNELREILLNRTSMEQIKSNTWNIEGKMFISPKTEALLYAASRQQHVDEVILPAEKEGKIVLCDRFIFSSLVYQGLVRELAIPYILNINPNTFPDLTLVLNAEPKKLLERGSREQDNRFELEEGLEFHEKSSEGFNWIVRYFHDNYPKIESHVLDALQSEEHVFENAKFYIEALLKRNNTEV